MFIVLLLIVLITLLVLFLLTNCLMPTELFVKFTLHSCAVGYKCDTLLLCRCIIATLNRTINYRANKYCVTRE